MIKVLGDYKKLYIGYSKDKVIRKKGSSGGIISAIIKYLFQEKKTDGVVCAGFDGIRPIIKKYLNIEDYLVDGVGSKYVKFYVKDYIDLIKNDTKSRLIIVAHPCVTTVLRKIYKDRDYLYVGFFCGWPMTYDATKRVIRHLGLKESEVESISYRAGIFPGGLQIKTKDKVYSFKKSFYKILNFLYLPKDCANCTFFTNENADISVGDCWIKDKKKYSSIIVRSGKGESIIQNMKGGRLINLENVLEDDLIRSHRLNIKVKRTGEWTMLSKISLFIKRFSFFHL